MYVYTLASGGGDSDFQTIGHQIGTKSFSKQVPQARFLCKTGHANSPREDSRDSPKSLLGTVFSIVNTSLHQLEDSTNSQDSSRVTAKYEEIGGGGGGAGSF